MNDATQSTEAEAPRRSGRERRQAESVYLDAKRNIVAERRKKAAKSSERSVRYRKRKAEDESSEEENDEEEDQFVNFSVDNDDEDDEQLSSDVEEEQAASDDEEEEEDKVVIRAKPTILMPWHWDSSSVRPVDSFSSVDGDKIIRYSYWGSNRRSLRCDAVLALLDAQESLVAEQDERSIILEHNFHRNSGLSQVPYHADMIPSYEYFAEGIKHITSLVSFKIVNYNLPQSPWLENNIFPVLKQNSNLTVLQLSNCFLSSDDLTSLTKFVAGNRTLSTLNICRTNIESEDTVKALAKALKKHPALRRVNLAYCSLAGGHDVLDKILTACKTCDSLEIGHENFDSESVAAVAKFLGKKHSLTSFSLAGAAVDKENKKLLSKAVLKNKTIQKLCLHSNNLQLPAIIRNTRKMTKSLSRLTHLDLSFNKLPVQGAKAMAKFLEEADCKLVSLIMTNNHLTTKGANVFLPALKKNTSLQHLDLSHNWLSDKCAAAVVDMLQDNSTLLTLDISKNRSLKANYVAEGKRSRWEYDENEESGSRWKYVAIDGGKAKIVKEALFDVTSLETIAACNHTCAVKMSGCNLGDSNEETIRKINALEVCEAKKIRHKIVFALNVVKRDLYDTRSFKDLPLEMMPYLLEMLQQRLSPTDFPRSLKRRGDATTLSRLYESIKTWQSLPLLFARGPGKRKKKVAQKKKSNPRKRRKFGDEEDEDDEAWIPKGARTTGK